MLTQTLLVGSAMMAEVIVYESYSNYIEVYYWKKIIIQEKVVYMILFIYTLEAKTSSVKIFVTCPKFRHFLPTKIVT